MACLRKNTELINTNSSWTMKNELKKGAIPAAHSYYVIYRELSTPRA